jgi:hypothetical protein
MDGAKVRDLREERRISPAEFAEAAAQAAGYRAARD